MAEADAVGRSNQRRRTRKALLEAASRLMREGRHPTLEEVAEEALVSRATAYRYFTGVEPLLLEASLDIAMPDRNLFAGDSENDPIARVRRADEAVQDMVARNEPALRMMLIQALRQSLDDGADAMPARQNRRTPLIEAALEPARDRLDAPCLDRLTKALALLVGTEAMLVFKDVLQVDDSEARAIKDWMIEALIEAAMKPACP